MYQVLSYVCPNFRFIMDVKKRTGMKNEIDIRVASPDPRDFIKVSNSKNVGCLGPERNSANDRTTYVPVSSLSNF